MAKKNGKTLQNPFIYQGFVSPEYFCDRIVETEELIETCKTDVIQYSFLPAELVKQDLLRMLFGS